VRHRRDARQRLAAESERGDRAEVLRAADFRRRVALERQPRVPVIRCASASSAFSISSLTTDAGRSTTSPAAIWFDSSGGS
jgi:hypothetical protein